jgi:hypothetical protein
MEEVIMDDVKKNLAAGIARVKWIAKFIAERARAETSIAKDLYAKSKVDNKMDEIYRDIGRRVLELSDSGGADVLHDSTVQNCLNEIKHMKEGAAEHKTGTGNSDGLPKE